MNDVTSTESASPAGAEPYLASTQVRRLLGISRATLYRWTQRGLPMHRFGPGTHMRFRMSEIERWMQTQHHDQPTPITEITG